MDNLLLTHSDAQVPDNNTPFALLVVSILGTFFGALILFLSDLPYKWIFVFAVAVCLSLLVLTIKSLNKTLTALLIFSLSMLVDINPWYSDRYTNLQPGFPISLTGLLLLISYTLWLLDSYQQSRPFRLFPIVTIPISLLVLWSGLSFVVAPQPVYMLTEFPGSLTILLLFVYMANTMKSEKDFYFIIKCIAFTVGFSSMLGICQYLAGSSFNLQFLGGRESQLEQEYYALTISRVSGLLVHANNLGFFLGGWLPVLLVCAIGMDRFGLRILCFLSFVLGLVTLVLTYSRGAWLAFAISLLVIAVPFLSTQWRKSLRGFLVRLIALGSVAVILTAPLFFRIVTRLTEDDYGAAYSRIPMAQTALVVIKSNLLNGVGLGNYKFVVSDYDPHPIMGSDGNPEPVHNIYLHMAAELGIPALGLFTWVLVIFLGKGVFTFRRADKSTSLFALGLIAGLAGLCLHGMFEPGNVGHPRFLHFFFMGGLLTGLGAMVRKNSNFVLGRRGRIIVHR